MDGDGVDEIVKVNFYDTSASAGTTTLKITIYGYNASTGVIAQKRHLMLRLMVLLTMVILSVQCVVVTISEISMEMVSRNC